jgi:hypothetical protein
MSNTTRPKKIKWKEIKPNPKLVWGPTVYSKEFRSFSLTTAVHDMLVFVSENKVRIVDTFVFNQQPHIKRVSVEIYYKEDERIEDSNGEPVWLSDL